MKSPALDALLRRASTEQVSYSEFDTQRDLVRAADATVFTRIRHIISLSKGPILMTLSTAMAAMGISLALWYAQPDQPSSTPVGNSKNTASKSLITLPLSDPSTQTPKASCGTKPSCASSTVAQATTPSKETEMIAQNNGDNDTPTTTVKDTSKKRRRLIVMTSVRDSSSNGNNGSATDVVTLTDDISGPQIGSDEDDIVTTEETSNGKRIRVKSKKDPTKELVIYRKECKTGQFTTDSIFATKMIIACDSVRVGNSGLTVKVSGTKPNGGFDLLAHQPMPKVDLKNRNALPVDDVLSSLGIVHKGGNYFFNDGSKTLRPGMHIDRFLSGMDNTIHIDVCRTSDSVIHDEDRPKVSFRPMYIVDSTGRVMEFCDAAINSTGKVNSAPEIMARYRDSCVTVVVHPDGKTPVYLLYYPTQEFLNALPREKALQVRAEQGNEAALRELQDSYRGCRYMSFCSTSNGAIEDTEILGSMSTDTRVKVTLREPRTVRVALYDIVGRLVAELDKGTHYEQGEHVFPLQFVRDTKQAATFYLLCITTDANEKVSQRVVLGN